MLGDQLPGDEVWQLQPLARLQHSRLYHLPPLGVGTPTVESLTSYVQRLALSHQVSPGVLVALEVAPLLRPSLLQGDRQSLSALFPKVVDRTTGAINGTGCMASTWVQALQTLTLRRDLQFLTCLTWRQLLPHRGLLRPIRAWCPICYADWNRCGIEVYEPLLWGLQVVTACPHHHCHLSLHCPSCQKSLPLLEWNSRPGFCSKCQRWLGSHTSVAAHERLLTSDELEWQTFVVQQLGELVATASSLPAVPERQQLSQRIDLSIQQLTHGNTQAFARLLCISATVPRDWRAGKSLPQLQMLLRLCYCLQTSLLNFFVGTVSVTALPLTSPLPPSQQLLKTNRPFDAPKLQSLLQAALIEHPPSSLKQLALRLGYQQCDLSTALPDLCHAISTRYLLHTQAQSQQKLAQLCQVARLAALTLHTAGIYPSDHQIQARLPARGYMKDPRIRAACQQVRRDLGLEP